eukprot:symbB.v1.2.006079.t1/scaffold332.1/size322744/14
MGLHLPPPNPFIPEDLSLKTAPSDNQVVPQLVTFKEPDVQAVSIFHRQDDLFQQPKAQVTFYIYSPYFQRDAASYLKTTLWSQCVEEALQEYAYDAQIAGVGYSLQLSGGSLKLVLAGFNDKLHVLLEAVTQKMVSMSSVPDHIFSIIMDTFTDDLRNQAYHSQPIQQASMRFEDLLNRGSSFPVLELLEILPQIQRSDLDNLCQNFFVEGSHVEALTLGNLTVENVKHLSHKLVTGLKLSKPLKSLPYRAEAQFPDGITLWKLDSVDVDDPNHAVMMKLQLPEGLEDEMQLMLLDKVLSAKFFEILRTQQQLGYIVQMAGTVSLKFPTLIALAQTEFPPDYVRGCIAKFMAEHFEFIQKSLTEDEFKVCQNGLISQLRMKPKNLREEARRFARQLNERSFDFARRERGARFVEQTTLEQFRSYVTETVMKAPQIYVQIKKVLEKDDKPLPSGASQFPDPTELRQWTGNESTVEAFGSNARWLPVNASVEVSDSQCIINVSKHVPPESVELSYNGKVLITKGCQIISDSSWRIDATGDVTVEQGALVSVKGALTINGSTVNVHDSTLTSSASLQLISTATSGVSRSPEMLQDGNLSIGIRIVNSTIKGPDVDISCNQSAMICEGITSIQVTDANKILEIFVATFRAGQKSQFVAGNIQIVTVSELQMEAKVPGTPTGKGLVSGTSLYLTTQGDMKLGNNVNTWNLASLTASGNDVVIADKGQFLISGSNTCQNHGGSPLC